MSLAIRYTKANTKPGHGREKALTDTRLGSRKGTNLKILFHSGGPVGICFFQEWYLVPRRVIMSRGGYHLVSGNQRPLLWGLALLFFFCKLTTTRYIRIPRDKKMIQSPHL
ncbi:hypothetical protein F5X99DRAFT_38731 [Biscogniauxia marginata]|nr:hypothetical protein F5X99DRAFT_38731 [Biscogniauxia marginata]